MNGLKKADNRHIGLWKQKNKRIDFLVSPYHGSELLIKEEIAYGPWALSKGDSWANFFKVENI